MALILEKSTRKLAFKQGKPTVQVVKPVRYQNITNAALVEEIAQTQGINKTMALAVVEAYVNRMVHYLDLGLGVQMGDFGTFRIGLKTKSADSPDKLSTDNVIRKHIVFHPGKAFRTMLQNMSVRMQGEEEEEDGTTPASSGSPAGEGEGGSGDNGGGDNGGDPGVNEG